MDVDVPAPSSDPTPAPPPTEPPPQPDDRLPTEDEIWYLVRTYFETYGFVRHQLDSFNNFLEFLLPHIVQESAEVKVRQGEDEEHRVTLCNVSVQRPSATDADGVDRDLLPHMARLRGLTYASAVLVDVVHDVYVGDAHAERRVFREVCLCRLPVMLGCHACHTQHREDTGECRLDQGGYFVVSGCEKVLISMEKLHHNVPYVFSVRQPSRYALQCELRSCNERKLRSTSSLYLYITNAKKGATPEMVATLPFVTMSIPVRALFKLLGVPTRDEVLDVVLGDSEDGASSAAGAAGAAGTAGAAGAADADDERRLIASILDNDATADMDVDDLYEHVGREGTREATRERRHRYLDHILNCETLPHQGLQRTPEVLRAKALFLGLMVRKLLRVYRGELQCDDRDHVATRRVDCAGTQFGLLFRQIFRAVQKSFSVQLHRLSEAGKLRCTNVGELVAGKKLTQAFRFALATGNWGILSTRGNTAQNGVSQQLGRMTTTSTLALLRKVSTPIARETKNPKPRQLATSAWGLICPMDTPEGGACGLSKSLALLAHVRVGTFSDAVHEQLALLATRLPSGTLAPAIEATAAERRDGMPLLVNGVLSMYVAAARLDAVADELRALRRAGAIPFDATVAVADRMLLVDTDGGCLLRPLLRVDRLRALPALLRDAPSHTQLVAALLAAGALEYVDKQEEEHCRVALSPLREPPEGWGAYTHCEIDPSLIVGLCGATIPFADYNQSPRNTYQSAMMKQATGVPMLNHARRMDTVLHVLVEPQRPLVTTRMDALIGASNAPAGANCIVCIMCYTGQNQEDSVIVNRAALERGLFRSVKYQTYRDEEHQHGGADAERFKNVGKMADVVGKRSANYAVLEESGLVAVGTRVRSGDVLIAKTVSTTDVGEGTRKTIERDKSTVLKHDGGVVDAVLQVANDDGTRLARVKVRSTRAPIVGDKVSSRMGQKGVIGAVLAPEDMPYAADGLVPDIIVNPHAIPSRMTIGQTTECLLAILCTLTGERGDGTMFRGTSLEFLAEELARAGYDRHGRVQLHCGFTGEAYESLVFVGPTYYQRLRHMAADKDHARARGPVHMLSRQPTEGRARDGGLRFGEMEKDCTISHGAAQFLSDRMLENSDPSTMTLCGKCGLLAQPAAARTHVRHKQPLCRNCGTGEHVRDMHSPFAFRLLLQEMQAMSIGVRFEF